MDGTIDHAARTTPDRVDTGATLSHDIYLASFATIGPGAHLAGSVPASVVKVRDGWLDAL